MEKRRIYLLSILVLILAIACACPGASGLSGARATATLAVVIPTFKIPTVVIPTIKIPTVVIPTIAVVAPTKAAAATPVRVPTPVKSPFIKDVVMALGVEGDLRNPVNPTQVFSTTATIHAVVQLLNAPANTQVTAGWYVVDVGSAAAPDTEIDETVITTSGTRNVDFTLKPTTAWPPGSYRVEISVNGVLSNRVTYTVK